MHTEMSNGIVRVDSTLEKLRGVTGQLGSNPAQDTAMGTDNTETSSTKFHSNFNKVSAAQVSSEETIVPLEIIAPSTLTPAEPHTSPYHRGIQFPTNTPELQPRASYYRRHDVPIPDAINQEADAAGIKPNKLGPVIMRPPAIVQPDLIPATSSSPNPMLVSAPQENIKFIEMPSAISQKLPDGINPIHSKSSAGGIIEEKLSSVITSPPSITQPDIPATYSSPETLLGSAPQEPGKTVTPPNAELQNLNSDIDLASLKISADRQAIAEKDALKSNTAQAVKPAQDLETLRNDKIEIEIAEKQATNFEAPKTKDPATTLSAVKDLQAPTLSNVTEKPFTTPFVGFTGPTASINTMPSVQSLTSLPQSHPAVQAVAQNLIRAQETQKGISIRLDPPEMGRVFIDFQFDADKNVTAIVRSELADTSQLLRGKSDFFQQILKENGFESVNLSFEQNENQTESEFDSDKDSPTHLFEMTDDLGTFNPKKAVSTSLHHKALDTSKIDMKL